MRGLESESRDGRESSEDFGAGVGDFSATGGGANEPHFQDGQSSIVTTAPGTPNKITAPRPSASPRVRAENERRATAKASAAASFLTVQSKTGTRGTSSPQNQEKPPLQ